VARVLIVGCGCRGQALARSLVESGHAVRGTTRSGERTGEIAAAGAEPFVGDPDRIATLMDALYGVTIVCWLLGSASGDPERVAALHDGRLRMLFEKLVDTGVRGVVYEAAGSAEAGALGRGEEIARDAHSRWLIPLEVLTVAPDDHGAWLGAAAGAVERLLAP
jgi:uncharacterized protein YbjT (DUF2867 family)